MIEIHDAESLPLQDSEGYIDIQTSEHKYLGHDISCITFYDSEISYENFFRNNMEKNEPCIFGNWLTQKWLASQEWVTPKRSINFEFLSQTFGDALVPVANCNEKYYDSQKKESLVFRDYIKYMDNVHENKQCLYLKDWHFAHEFPDYEAYSTPPFFASDWLNEFWFLRQDGSDDYRFVYLGPKGSWTPFHADVFRSFSWSANVCGRKRWVLYPPSQELNLQDKLGNLAYDVEAAELRDKTLYPNADLAKGRIEVIQEAGQTIFVPSRWHHQVWNLEDTVSINHNWINGTNILAVWDFLLFSLREVEKAIEDCLGMDGWVNQCQLILKATHGMNFLEYFYFLKTIGRRRLAYLAGDTTLSSFSSCQFGKNHVIYDVKKLVTCLELLLDEPHSDGADIYEEDDHPTHLLDNLQTVL